jgi:hypothetical protein
MLEFGNPDTWRDIMSKHGRSTANPRSENKRSKIQSWLMQEGWKIGEAQHPQASWVIAATNPGGFSLVIAQPQNTPDRIDIQSSVIIGDDHQKLIAAMEPKERQDLWWGLRFALLKMGVDFGGFDEPVKMLAVIQRMYDDGLTKDRFLQRVTKIKNSQVLILWTIRRAFDQPPGDDVLDSGFIQ